LFILLVFVFLITNVGANYGSPKVIDGTVTNKYTSTSSSGGVTIIKPVVWFMPSRRHTNYYVEVSTSSGLMKINNAELYSNVEKGMKIRMSYREQINSTSDSRYKIDYVHEIS